MATKKELTANDAEAEKFQAEAEKFLAEADQARANAEKLRMEADAQAAIARKENAVAAQNEIELAKKRRVEKKELTANEYHHVYVFSGAVTTTSVDSCMRQLAAWMRGEPGCDIEIVFSSPGGSVVDGLALFDYIQGVRRAGHHVTTSALGMAASMAGILLQAGDERVMTAESWLLIHEASFGALGKIGEVEDTVDWVKKVLERVANIFVDRADGKISKATFKKRWARRDWWISSADALKYGFVDSVR